MPDLAILRVNMRPRTSDDQEIAARLIAKALDDTAKQHDVFIEAHGGFARPPKPLTEEAEGLFKLVKQAGADLGQSIGWQPSGGVRRQQHCCLRCAGRRHDGRAGRQDPQHGGISDRR